MRTQPIQSSEAYVVNAMILQTQSDQQSYLLTEKNHVPAEFKTISGVYALISRAVHAFSRDSAPIVQDEITFEYLRLEWQRERGATSSITGMAICPSYQRIIAMGEKVVPLILRQMEIEGDEPDMWFWALHILTGADPITDDDRGDIVRMAQVWLLWARGRYAW